MILLLPLHLDLHLSQFGRLCRTADEDLSTLGHHFSKVSPLLAELGVFLQSEGDYAEIAGQLRTSDPVHHLTAFYGLGAFQRLVRISPELRQRFAAALHASEDLSMLSDDSFWRQTLILCRGWDDNFENLPFTALLASWVFGAEGSEISPISREEEYFVSNMARVYRHGLFRSFVEVHAHEDPSLAKRLYQWLILLGEVAERLDLGGPHDEVLYHREISLERDVQKLIEVCRETGDGDSAARLEAELAQHHATLKPLEP